MKPAKDPAKPSQDFILSVKITRVDFSHPRNMRFAPEFANIWNLQKSEKECPNTHTKESKEKKFLGIQQ